MKFIALAFITFLSFQGLEQRTIKDYRYKQFRVQIGNKWFGADSKITKEELQQNRVMAFQSIKDSSIVNIKNYWWEIWLNTKDKEGNYVYANYSLQQKTIPLNNIKSGDAFYISQIRTLTSKQRFPTEFRLYIK